MQKAAAKQLIDTLDQEIPTGDLFAALQTALILTKSLKETLVLSGYNNADPDTVSPKPRMTATMLDVLSVVAANWPYGRPSNLRKMEWYRLIGKACRESGVIACERVIRDAIKFGSFNK